MRTTPSLQKLASGLFTILIPLVLFGTQAHSVAAQTCPPPFVRMGGQCVLTADEPALKHTIIPASNTILNCRSHKLVASVQGSIEGDLKKASEPAVAIFLNAVENVQIKNCVILDFDFGIFAINSKHPPRGAPIRILQNKKIKARFAAISLMSVDDAVIKGNRELEWTTRGGRGLYVGRDSDRNKILDNHFLADINNSFKALRAPGPESVSNPAVDQGSAVLITQIEGTEPTLLNAIIETLDTQTNTLQPGLYQLPVNYSENPNAFFSADNVFEGNTISISGTQPVDGVALAIPQRTIVRKNTITGARFSIRVGVQTGTKQIHAQCTKLDPNPQPHPRFCLGPEDCNIFGIDLGTCELLPQKHVTWVSRNSLIEANKINGPFNFGIVTAGAHTQVKCNTIVGPLRDANTGAGIALNGKFGLEGSPPFTIVKGNSVTNTAVALNLNQSVLNQPEASATRFKAEIRMNDFIGATITVKLSSGYDLLTELSGGGKGNFWGPCPPGFEPSKVEPDNPKVTDSHPFCVKVARANPSSPCSPSR